MALHVGHLGGRFGDQVPPHGTQPYNGRLGSWVFLLCPWEGGLESGWLDHRKQPYKVDRDNGSSCWTWLILSILIQVQRCHPRMIPKNCSKARERRFIFRWIPVTWGNNFVINTFHFQTLYKAIYRRKKIWIVYITRTNLRIINDNRCRNMITWNVANHRCIITDWKFWSLFSSDCWFPKMQMTMFHSEVLPTTAFQSQDPLQTTRPPGLTTRSRRIRH